MGGSSNGKVPDSPPVTHTVTAYFDDPEAAQAAIAELRGLGIDPADISVTVEGWEADERSDAATDSAEGIARREIGTSDVERVSPELPNDEDLPTTEAYMTGRGATAQEYPVASDSDMVRRVEAPADVDIYTDFPNAPGGLSPDSTLVGSEASEGATADGHSPNSGEPPAKGKGAAVTISTDDAGRDFVRPVLEAHGGFSRDQGPEVGEQV
jgi:hypothetical protein